MEPNLLIHPEILYAALESSSNHIVITNPEGKIIYANKAVSTITGYDREEIIGNSPHLWGGLMSQDFYQTFWDTIKNKKLPFSGEIQNRRKNGELYTALSRVSPILGPHEELWGFIGTEEDITKRKERELTLEQRTTELTQTKSQIEHEKARYQALLTSIGDGVVACDPDGIAIFVNSAAEKMIGVTEKDMLGNVWAMSLPKVVDDHGNPVPRNELAHMVAKNTGHIAHATYNYITAAGITMPVAVTASPIIFDERFLGTIIVFRDITNEKQIDQAKTEFVSLASHQLRTPLSAVNWYGEMLLAGDGGPLNTEQRRYAQEIYAANNRMIQLVNALLNVSRIELGTFSVQPQELSPLAILRSVMDELKPTIDEKKLRFTEAHDENLTTAADPILLRAIFQNLLTNAVKYTPEQGTITVRLYRLSENQIIHTTSVPEGSIIFSVADTGYGIPRNQSDKIFTKLFRADNVRTQDTQGTGLGLYIIKSICKAAGGDVWFSSEENVGTTFYYSIPPEGMQTKNGEKQLAL